MEIWVYIAVFVIYLIFNAFKNTEKASNPKEEGKNKNPSTNPERNVIHQSGKNKGGSLMAEYEQKKKQERENKRSNPEGNEADRTLEGISLDDFLNSRQEKPSADNPREEMEQVLASHYSEESLVAEYTRTHAKGQQISHHSHPSSEGLGAFDYDKKRSKRSHFTRVLTGPHSIRNAYVVNLLLERKFDDEGSLK